ncbi:UNVERIFIED_CONTAM: hypothetical protein FKN15_000272 [Acipenser sinensis]
MVILKVLDTRMFKSWLGHLLSVTLSKLLNPLVLPSFRMRHETEVPSSGAAAVDAQFTP